MAAGASAHTNPQFGRVALEGEGIGGDASGGTSALGIDERHRLDERRRIPPGRIEIDALRQLRAQIRLADDGRALEDEPAHVA